MMFQFRPIVLSVVAALTVLLPSSTWTAQALFKEDAGSLDFLVPTTGHGVTRFVHSTSLDDGKAVMVTSDSYPQANKALPSDQVTPTSCYVACRSVDDGELLWRRNVCSSPTPPDGFAVGPVHVATVSGEHVYTMDQTGVVRAWSISNGMLVWDLPTSPTFQPRLWTITSNESHPYVAVAAAADDLVVVDGKTGRLVGNLLASKALEHSDIKPKSSEIPRWLTILPTSTTHPENGAIVIRALVGFVATPKMTVVGKRMAMVDLHVLDGNITPGSVTRFNEHVKNPFNALSLQIQMAADEWHGLAISESGSDLFDFTIESTDGMAESYASSLHSEWTSLTSVSPTSDPSIVRLSGIDKRDEKEKSEMFRFDRKEFLWQPLEGNQQKDSNYDATSYCSEAGLFVAVLPDSLQVWKQESGALRPVTVTGDLFGPDGDSVEALSLLTCSSDAASFLLATSSGTTTHLSFDVNQQNVALKVDWTAEEGLSDISSAVLLDGSHLGADDLIEEQEVVLAKLSLPSRLASQWTGIVSKFSGVVDGALGRRDHIFGFVKIAAILSQKSHRVWGMNTSGKDRGSIRWSLDLPKTASWHTMVHGTTNSPKAQHGINGGTHSREILVISASEKTVEWTCVDGTNGAVHASGKQSFESPVVQVLPLHGGAGLCRQTSLLLHADRSLSVVPEDDESISFVAKQIQSTPNGLYAHIVDKSENLLETFRISSSGGESLTPLRAKQVGRTSFSGEQIVKVAYPVRDEIVQSMSTVLGDDSLLLKYINPHVAVIITMSDAVEEQTGSLAKAATKLQAPKKRKPAGAGDSTNTNPASDADELPNMFVNVVDSVSGRVLYRASHANADQASPISAVISENWIVYSFVNQKTRRAELGVLTLHEGMIHSKGLTAFTSPEQTLSFSSFDARESKPVVLPKTYSFPKAITALGATSTRSGISNRKILIASADGKITAVERKMLETRRPTGEVKEAEKKEGLFQ